MIAISRSSKVLRSQARATRDAGEHAWPDLVCIVEGEDEIGPAFTRENPVRSGRPLHGPPNAKQRSEDQPCLRGRPDAHAASKRSVTCGIASPCSKRSARTRSASTSALANASSRVEPYAITPGRATTSAIQRPSSSRSISTTNLLLAMFRAYQPVRRIAR